MKKFFLVLRMFQKNIRGTRKRKMGKLLSRTFSHFAPPAADIFLPLSPLSLPCSTCGAPFPLLPLVFSLGACAARNCASHFPLECACGAPLFTSFSLWETTNVLKNIREFPYKKVRISRFWGFCTF